jgi:hypothetical protein
MAASSKGHQAHDAATRARCSRFGIRLLLKAVHPQELESAMTETDDISARLAAIETIVRHLLTHLAVRADDPPSWVATRKVLALHAVRVDHEDAHALPGRIESMQAAIASLFDTVEAAVADYAVAETAGVRRR